MPPETATETNGAGTKRIAIGTKEQKLEFDIPQRYTEGHVITAAEAKSLNQTMAENIGNNFRARVQAHLNGEDGALSEEELRQAFEEYAAKYEFSMGSTGAGTRTMTPLERESRKIATAIVRQLLAKDGRKVATKKTPEGPKVVSAEAFEGEVARIAATEKVQKLAQKQIRDTEKLVNEAMEAGAAE